MIRRFASTFAVLLLSAGAAVAADTVAAMPQPAPPPRSSLIQGCWGAADKGDGADFKLAFRGDGSLVQYDEKQQDKLRRTFGAWEMQEGSSFLVVYWPDGGVTRYNVKRIGPILHFTGMFGVRNFTLHELELRNCWRPIE